MVGQLPSYYHLRKARSFIILPLVWLALFSSFNQRWKFTCSGLASRKWWWSASCLPALTRRRGRRLQRRKSGERFDLLLFCICHGVDMHGVVNESRNCISFLAEQNHLIWVVGEREEKKKRGNGQNGTPNFSPSLVCWQAENIGFNI